MVKKLEKLRGDGYIPPVHPLSATEYNTEQCVLLMIRSMLDSFLINVSACHLKLQINK